MTVNRKSSTVSGCPSCQTRFGFSFHLVSGCLRVPLTRPRQARLVVGREGDEVCKDQPPTPARLGWDPDPVREG